MKFNQGMSAPEIVTALEGRVTESTVYSILRVFKDENRQSKKKKGGSSRQYTPEDWKIIETIQAENNGYTYKQIREKWRERTGKLTAKLSNSTIERILQEFDYTTKNLEKEPAARNTPEAIEFRKNYCIEAAGWDMNELVYIDEKGFNLHQTGGEVGAREERKR